MSQFCAATRAAVQKLGVLESILKLLHISKIVPVGLLGEVKERKAGFQVLLCILTIWRGFILFLVSVLAFILPYESSEILIAKLRC